jgi:hypothetical protein
LSLRLELISLSKNRIAMFDMSIVYLVICCFSTLMILSCIFRESPKLNQIVICRKE